MNNESIKTQVSEKLKWISEVINEHPMIVDSIINEMFINDKLSKNFEVSLIMAFAMISKLIKGDS
jgi:hypothetical protein